MTGTLLDLALAAFAFVALHVGIASTPLRSRLIARFGEKGYQGLFALVALIALVWMCVAYGEAPTVPLWDAQPWQSWVPVLVTPVSLLMIVASAASPNPTAAGQIDQLEGELPVQGVQRITRNPQLWAIGLWAIGHMVPNGDVASVILFGSLALLAIGGSFLLDRRLGQRGDARWARFVGVTSNVPFAAVLSGRQTFRPSEIRLSSVLIATVLYIGLAYVHPWLFSVSARPQW